jgi:hypothetical protein
MPKVAAIFRVNIPLILLEHTRKYENDNSKKIIQMNSQVHLQM